MHRREAGRGPLLAPRYGELAQQALLLLVERRRDLHLDVHVQVAAAAAVQPPDPEPALR